MDQATNLRVITTEDPNMILRKQYDDKNHAQRVIIVGAEVPEIKMGDLKFPEQKDIQVIEVPKIVYETKIVEIEKQVIVKEFERVEIPIYVQQLEIREIEKPVYIDRPIETIREVPVYLTKIEYVDKPIFIEKTISTTQDLPKWLIICTLAQVMATIILLVKTIIK